MNTKWSWKFIKHIESLSAKCWKHVQWSQCIIIDGALKPIKIISKLCINIFTKIKFYFKPKITNISIFLCYFYVTITTPLSSANLKSLISFSSIFILSFLNSCHHMLLLSLAYHRCWKRLVAMAILSKASLPIIKGVISPWSVLPMLSTLSPMFIVQQSILDYNQGW